MANELIISSDSHVFEPPDLWTQRIDKAFRDRAPRLQRIGDVDKVVLDDGQPFSGIGLISNAGARFEAPETISDHGRFDEVHSGGYDPAQHIVDMGLDGVHAKVDGEYVVVLNEDGLPRLKLSPYYRKMMEKGKENNADTKNYIRDKFRSALWLIKSLEQRQRTIFKVAESVVKHQRAFLEKGIHHMKPLVLRDVAEDIQMHESTVSRVVSNKYMHTPRGVFEMRYFFHSGISSDGGSDVSSLSVKGKIQDFINGENAEKPLSDSAIVKLLKQEGLEIARRTVAKYREEMKIPSSTHRRQLL